MKNSNELPIFCLPINLRGWWYFDPEGVSDIVSLTQPINSEVPLQVDSYKQHPVDLHLIIATRFTKHTEKYVWINGLLIPADLIWQIKNGCILLGNGYRVTKEQSYRNKTAIFLLSFLKS